MAHTQETHCAHEVVRPRPGPVRTTHATCAAVPSGKAGGAKAHAPLSLWKLSFMRWRWFNLEEWKRPCMISSLTEFIDASTWLLSCGCDAATCAADSRDSAGGRGAQLTRDAVVGSKGRQNGFPKRNPWGTPTPLWNPVAGR